MGKSVLIAAAIGGALGWALLKDDSPILKGAAIGATVQILLRSSGVS